MITKTILLSITLLASTAAAGEWKQLPSLPDKEGFAGCFAGVSNGALIVAGGSNFPDKRPWEGGKKIWYDSIFILDRPTGEWKVVGKLPRPVGYGVSATYHDTIICVGGSDADRHYADVFRLDQRDGKIITTSLPSLPSAVANACGVIVADSHLYIAGGQETPDAGTALDKLFEIDLAALEPKWRERDHCPGGGRILAVAASFDNAFWLIGGAELTPGEGSKVKRRYRKDAWRYDLGKGWTRVADLPHAVVAAPSPAPVDDRGIFVLGGDDGSQISIAPADHRGFSKTILRFDAQSAAWTTAGKITAPRVTVPSVLWNKAWIIAGGEAKPGIRSPEVWSFIPESEK
jgi:N-acetylneuraminate epimerase